MRNRLILIWSVGALAAQLAIATGRAAEQPAVTQPKPNSATTPNSTRSDSATDAKSAKAKGKVDLNMASTEEIEALPGVGPTIAQAIVKARPFKSVNELTNVAGIGPAKFAVLKPQVMVKPPTAAVGKAPRGETGSGVAGSGKDAAEKSTGKPTAVAPAPERERATSPVPSTKSAPSTGQKVNLNTATLEQLEALPGIGPVKAQAIIDARPFRSIDEVTKVNGIKEGIFNEIKDQITVK